MPPYIRVLCIAAAGVAAVGARPLAAPAADTTAPSLRFALRDTTGAAHTDADWAGARAIVVFFITPDCPISQGYVPEMNRIAQTYRSRGVKAFAVQSDRVARDADVRRHAAEYAYAFPLLLDPAHVLVRHTDATTTPEAVVMSPAGRVLYQGRIDDRIVSLGTRRPRATRHDLRAALDDVLAGRAVAIPRTAAVGCLIDKRGSGVI